METAGKSWPFCVLHDECVVLQNWHSVKRGDLPPTCDFESSISSLFGERRSGSLVPGFSRIVIEIPGNSGTKCYDKMLRLGRFREGDERQLVDSNWLPPRDSNPDMLIQSQLSYH